MTDDKSVPGGPRPPGDGAQHGGFEGPGPSHRVSGPEHPGQPAQHPQAPQHGPAQHQQAPLQESAHHQPQSLQPPEPSQSAQPPHFQHAPRGEVSQHGAQAQVGRRPQRFVKRVLHETSGAAKAAIAGAIVVAIVAVAAIVAAVRDDDQHSNTAPRPPEATTAPADSRAGAADATFSGGAGDGESVTYPFTVDAGTVSYFASDPGCTATNLQWVVEDTAGSPVSTTAVVCGDIGRVAFPDGGNFRIRVYTVGEVTGEYSVSQLASRPDRELSIEPDHTESGDIDLPGARDLYTFSVDAGTVAYFASGPCETSGLEWVIETADGAPASHAAVACGDIGRVEFPTAGTYRANVYSTGGATGTYDITWRTSRADRQGTITVGQTVTGEIDLPGAQDLYAIDAAEPLVAYFAAADQCAADGIYWTIEDSAGSPLAATRLICDDIGRVELPAGSSRARVESSGGGTGAYEITWLASGADTVRPISGGTVEGEIDVPGGRDRWTFTAAAGDTVILTADPGCSTDGLYWAVQTAAGTSVRGEFLCHDLGEVTLPETGEYAVVVYGDLRSTGSYRFNVDDD